MHIQVQIYIYIYIFIYFYSYICIYLFIFIFPCSHTGYSSFRLEELQVIDIEFLHGCQNPTIVFIYQVELLVQNFCRVLLNFQCGIFSEEHFSIDETINHYGGQYSFFCCNRSLGLYCSQVFCRQCVTPKVWWMVPKSLEMVLLQSLSLKNTLLG